MVFEERAMGMHRQRPLPHEVFPGKGKTPTPRGHSCTSWDWMIPPTGESFSRDNSVKGKVVSPWS